MTQNIIAISIVFLAAAITVYALIKSVTGKKASPCAGCSGCELRDKLAPGECASHNTDGFKVRKLNIGIAKIPESGK